jgi:hypothetical protein
MKSRRKKRHERKRGNYFEYGKRRDKEGQEKEIIIVEMNITKVHVPHTGEEIV